MSLTKDKKIWRPGALRPGSKDLPNSGQITLDQINVEAGGVSKSSCSINDSDIRGLINKGSGVQMAMSEWHGASSSIEFVTSASRYSTGTNSVRSLSLTGLGIQTGDLVVVASSAQGLGDLWHGPITSGWTACDANQGYVNWQTSYRYYKQMGATVDTTFQISTSEGSWQYYNQPAIIVVFRNTAASPTNVASQIQTNQTLNFIPGSVSVANSDSLHIIVGTRAGNGEPNAKSGWTAVTNVKTTDQNGSFYSNSCTVWYKLGVYSGSANIGEVTYSGSYARINSAQLVFN